jgi:phosphoglucosamine mutase
LSGDQLLAIGARFLHQRGQLWNDVLVSTVMSNVGLKESLRAIGVRHVVCDVGDRHVMEKMTAVGAALGGEDSGHILYKAHHSTGDGLLSALMLIQALLEEERPLSELANCMTVYPQTLLNIPVNEKPALETLRPVQDTIRTVEDKLGREGRVLVRYSGTQQICRVMVEGPTQDRADEHAQHIASAVREAIGK